ncbi:hypothetical protein EJB05_15437, partial [Eragrostis curvula]
MKKLTFPCSLRSANESNGSCRRHHRSDGDHCPATPQNEALPIAAADDGCVGAAVRRTRREETNTYARARFDPPDPKFSFLILHIVMSDEEDNLCSSESATGEEESEYEVNSDDDDMQGNGNGGSHHEEVIDDATLFRSFKILRTMSNTIDEHLQSRVAQNSSAGPSNRNRTAVASKASSRCHLRYFKQVIDSLDDQRKNVIVNFGFPSLLEFDGSTVPRTFVQWIADKVDVNCGDIIVAGKSIPLNPLAVHKVTGLPLGGRVIETDDACKAEFLRLINSPTLPKVKSLGAKIISKQPMSDEDLFWYFMVVALSKFLAPNSSTVASPQYFSPLIDLSTVTEWDWSKFVCDKLLDSISKYILKKRHTLGGCIYFLAVYYLDFLRFGSRVPSIPRTIPRINVWKGQMIKIYSLYDKISANVYGKGPVKSIEETCYAPSSADDQYESFKQSLSLRFGYLPNEVTEQLSSIFKTFSDNDFAAPDYSPDQLVLSMFQFMHESSASIPEHQNSDDGTGAAASHDENFDDHTGDVATGNGIAEDYDAHNDFNDVPADGNDVEMPANNVPYNEEAPVEDLTQRVESDGNNAVCSEDNAGSQATVVLPSDNSVSKCALLV